MKTKSYIVKFLPQQHWPAFRQYGPPASDYPSGASSICSIDKDQHTPDRQGGTEDGPTSTRSIETDPPIDPLRNEPRLQAIERELKFPN